MKQFLHLADIPADEVQHLLELARHLQEHPIQTTLLHKVVGLLFMNPSLRTLASIQAGIAQLGGQSFMLQPGQSSWNLELEDGAVMDGSAQEHIRDALPVLGKYCDLLGVRCFASGSDLQSDLEDATIAKMAELCGQPFVNLESASDHPCQALADWKALDDVRVPKDGKFVLSWAWHPRPLPYAVPYAAASMAALRGMRVTVLRPDGFDLPAEIMQRVRSLSQSPVEVTSNKEEALQGADVLYVKSWVAPSTYGDPEHDKVLRSHLRGWCPDASWLNSDTYFMHCLPVRRNVEASDELIESRRSLVLRQAENRLHVQKAVMSAWIESL